MIEELEILEELYQANEIGLAVNFFAKLEAELNALSDVLSSSSAYIKVTFIFIFSYLTVSRGLMGRRKG